MIILIITFFITIVLILLLFYYFASGKYDLNKAKEEFCIPGLDTDFVPQGIAYSKQYNKFFVSGYMKSHVASRVYVVDGESRNIEKYVLFKRMDGIVYTGHAGGISTYSESVYISSEKKVYRFLLKDLILAKNAEFINFCSELNSQNGADFCLAKNGQIFVGEFYKFAKFPTDQSHHILIDGKTQNNAIVFVFKLSSSGDFANSMPSFAISVPDLVQGMVLFENKIVLSSSYGLNKSKISVYESDFLKKANRTIAVKESHIPLYILSNKDLIKSFALPPMAEEIELVDDKLFILFESASKKYKLYNRVRIKKVYSLKIK